MYVLYGVKYIGPVSLDGFDEASLLYFDLGHSPYVLYGVKYIGPVSLAPAPEGSDEGRIADHEAGPFIT